MLALLTLLLLVLEFQCLKFEYNGMQARKLIRRENRMEYSRQHPIKFCEDYNYDMGKCIACFDGYSLFGKQCLLDDSDINITPILIWRNPYCEEYNSKDQCLSCYDGYVFKDGECQTDLQDLPNSDFIVPSLNSMKIEDHEFCFEFSASGRCKSCFKGADLKDGRCQLPDYEQYECRTRNTCYPIVTPCLVYSNQGFCKMCEQGSINMNGQCRLIKRESLCYVYSNKRQCLKCSAYAIMIKGKCVYRQPNCIRQNQHGTCLQCNSKSMLHNGQCHLYSSSIPFFYRDPNCISWKDGFCYQCSYGWSLTFARLCKSNQ